EVALEVAAHLGVGILADHERGARVVDEDRAQAPVDPGPRDDLLDLAGDLVGAAPLRRQGEALRMEHASLLRAESNRLTRATEGDAPRRIPAGEVELSGPTEPAFTRARR